MIFPRCIQGTLPQNIFILKSGHTGYRNSEKNRWSTNLCLEIGMNGNVKKFQLFYGSLKLFLHSMCGAKSALLYSICGANLLRTLNIASYFAPHMKRAMQTLLHTWNGYIVSGTKNNQKLQQLSFLKKNPHCIFSPLTFFEII